MSNNSYEKFFKTAQEVRRADEPPAKVEFKIKNKPKSKPTAATATATADHEGRLRSAVKMRKRRAPVPKKAVAGLVLSLGIAGLYVFSPDFFPHLFDKIEVRAMGQAEAADKKEGEKAAEKSSTTTGKEEKRAAGEAAPASAKGPGEKPAVHEDLSQYEKLKQRKEELDGREKELTELEEELQRQKVELDRRIQQLEDMRSQIAQTLKDRVEIDQEKVNKLVDLYSNMKPKQAADVINSINEDLAVEVLAKMKKKNAAEIMNLLPPEKARVLSEKYTGYHRAKDEPKG